MDYGTTRFSAQFIDFRSYVITACATVVAAIGIRYVFHRFQQQNKSSEKSKSTQEMDEHCKHDDGVGSKVTYVKTRQSRLLRKQFGIIEDDLQLYEEPPIVSDDAEIPLIKDEGNINYKQTSAEDVETSVDGRNEKTGLNENKLAAPAGTKMDMNNYENLNNIRSEEDSQEQQANVVAVSPPSSPASALQRKKSMKEQQKSQYERLQEYRRRQMLVAVEARLEQQRLFRSERIVPPLFHFWSWYDAQTSLYRQYTLVRNDGVIDNATTVTYHPSSRRSDKVSIQLRITNDLNVPISVYWVDHIGKHVPKGLILSHGGNWQQTTYVDHPWVFKAAAASSIAATDDTSADSCGHLIGKDNVERVLLHYIPHQVIPSLKNASALDYEINSATNVKTGIHRFNIVPSVTEELAMYNCTVHDPVLPFPASKHILTARKAAEFALQHCIRMRYNKWVVLQKYIRNIIDYPNDIRYRCIRIANPIFSDAIWTTPAKGVLLAYSFIEQCDIGYVCFGGNINTDDEDEEPTRLSFETLQELQLLLHMIQFFEQKAMIDNSE